jgi:hypothetical protein
MMPARESTESADLPDIVDVGAEASWIPAESPSPAVPAHLERLADRAGDNFAASSANTRRAHAADWRHFTACCRRQGLSPFPRTHRSSAPTSLLAHRARERRTGSPIR